MPRTDAIFPGGNSIDAERARRGGLRKIGMIEHGNPRVGPRVLLTHYFYLSGLPELVDRNNLAVVVEWSDADNLSGADVDEAVGVKGSVIVADVERAARRDHLHVGVEDTGIVGELEAALDG